MTYVKDLPFCRSRFGRTNMVDNRGKLVPKFILTCGYREVDPEECICCGGFIGEKIELKIDTFIIMKKDRQKQMR